MTTEHETKIEMNLYGLFRFVCSCGLKGTYKHGAAEAKFSLRTKHTKAGV